MLKPWNGAKEGVLVTKWVKTGWFEHCNKLQRMCVKYAEDVDILQRVKAEPFYYGIIISERVWGMICECHLTQRVYVECASYYCRTTMKHCDVCKF